MMLASLGCVFQELLLAAPVSCRLQVHKVSQFLGMPYRSCIFMAKLMTSDLQNLPV